MYALLPPIAGAAVGATLAYLYNRFSDRASPLASILRAGYTTTVPAAARDIRACLPHELAQRINANPAVPGYADSTKELPLGSHIDEVKRIKGIIRNELVAYERALGSTFPRLVQALDQNDHLGFARVFAEDCRFLWAAIRGRVRRDQAPPEVPAQPVDLSTVRAKDGLIVRTDKDGDYVLDLPGLVFRVYLIWSGENVPEQAERCKKVASALLQDIAEFRTDRLRTIVGAIHREVQALAAELSDLHDAVSEELEKFSFLEVLTLLRNRGKRPYCVDRAARLFVNTTGYAFQSTALGTLEIHKDLELDLIADVPEQEIVAVSGDHPRLVRFVSRIPMRQLQDYEALLTLGRTGERSCRLGLRLFTEKISRVYHTAPVAFRTFESTAVIPRPPERLKWLPN